MDEENEQQEKNQQDSFFKQQGNKAKDKLKDDIKKKSKGLLKKFFKLLPLPAKLAIIGIILGICSPIIIALIWYAVEDDAEESTNNAKTQSIQTSYYASATTGTTTGTATGTATDTDTSSTNKVAVTMNANNNGLEFSYNNDIDYLESVRKDLINQVINSPADFTDFELAVLGALMENGANLDSYTVDELRCLPVFVKAEACTKNLDLRPNSEKFEGSTDYTSDNYVPQTIENLQDNEVPGTILVKRTNTNGTITWLEYVDKTTFDGLVSAGDITAIDKFTINDNGNLVCATWDNITVTVEGDYPDKLPDEQRTAEMNTNFIDSKEINYTQLIEQYTMPFEFLNQLLVITREPDFCNELVNYVLNSKIIINLQEEETITVTTEENTYDIHYREEKNIDYDFTPNIESKTDYLIRTKNGNVTINDNETDCTTDDEGNACTVYTNEKTTNPVIITTTYTEHTYVLEILEAQTWIADYKKEYTTQPAVTNETIKDASVENLGTYQAEQENILQDEQEIIKDTHAQKFKELKETHYRAKVAIPEVTVKKVSTTSSSSSSTNSNSTSTSQSTPAPGPAPIVTPGPQATTNNNSTNSVAWKIDVKDVGVKFNTSIDISKTYTSLPAEFNITTIETQDLIGGITFTYSRNTNNTYSLKSTNREEVLKCNINKLSIKPFTKINTTTVTNQTVTKYPSDPTPVINVDIFAIDENENYEKFLAAYDNSKGAQNQIESADVLLYEMMEENQSTEQFVEQVKLLLKIYKTGSLDNIDLTEFKKLFLVEPYEFISSSSAGNISLTTPILSREDFIKAMEEYNGGTDYNNNFKSIAGEIYDLGIKYGVNPELIVTMARKESSFKPAGGQNYWGLDTPNGASVAYYATFEDGVKRLAEVFKTYMPGGSMASLISQRKNERSAANCNTNGYGDPGTLKGMLSVYSDLCGSDTKHRDGSWGSGGNIYLKKIYGAEFAQKCGNVHKIGVDDYTIQEKSDYTAWLYENQIDYWNDIFGKYGSIASGEGLLSEAQEIWEIISKSGSGYTYGGSSVPCTNKKIDCSSFVSWVLLEYGYTEFQGGQTTTLVFYNTNWNKKYGWEEIHLAPGENPTSKLQPGDIYVRYSSGKGHVCIVSEVKNGTVYGYDCGATDHWENKNGSIYDVTWFMNDNRPGKIIRVTPPQS